jgi:hypothetical protein
VRIFRRAVERELTEAMAYARCHGERGTEILSVEKRPPYRLPERRRGHDVTVPGELLRQAFAQRLDRRLSASSETETRARARS